MDTKLTPTELASIASISAPYASQIIGGTRRWTIPIALAVFNARRLKFGPLAGRSDEEIASLVDAKQLVDDAERYAA